MLYSESSTRSFPAGQQRGIVNAMEKEADKRRKQRRLNLQKLLEIRFAGSKAELARTIGKDDAFIWQLLKGERNIGQDLAPEIETRLGLPPYALDRPLTEDELRLQKADNLLAELEKVVPGARDQMVKFMGASQSLQPPTTNEPQSFDTSRRYSERRQHDVGRPGGKPERRKVEK